MEDETGSILSFQDLEDEEEDAVSLRDLSTATFDPEESDPYTESSFPSPSKQDVFEFSNIGPSTEAVPDADAILFCGRAIPFEEPGYLRLPSSSFKRLRSGGWESEDALLTRSESLRFPCSKVAVPAPGSCRYSTGSGRKYKALIGVTKFPSRMDMSEIRRRQSRQAPAPMFPASADGGSTALAAEGGRGHGHLGLLKFKPLRCKSHLLSALARASLGCIRHV